MYIVKFNTGVHYPLLGRRVSSTKAFTEEYGKLIWGEKTAGGSEFREGSMEAEGYKDRLGINWERC